MGVSRPLHPAEELWDENNNLMNQDIIIEQMYLSNASVVVMVYENVNGEYIDDVDHAFFTISWHSEVLQRHIFNVSSGQKKREHLPNAHTIPISYNMLQIRQADVRVL